MSTDACHVIGSVDPNTHFGADIAWCRTHQRLASQCGDIASLRQEVGTLLEALKEAETALRLIENRDQFWPGMESLEIHAEAALKRIRSAIAAATRET